MNKLTTTVRTAVERAPCSIRALAKVAGVPHVTLAHIVHSRREATEDVARKVARALDGWAKKCGRSAADIRQELKKGR